MNRTTVAEPAGKEAKEAMPRRGTRRVRLDTQKIVSAGLEVAAESATGTFSPKLLGDKLGVDPSAVYRHFSSKQHLMEALLDAVHLRTLEQVTAPRDDWRERIEQLASATLIEYCRYPSIAGEAMNLTTHGPGEFGAIELLLDALHTCGLSDDGVVTNYALISSYILSMASGIARSRTDLGELRPEDPEDDGPWLDGPILADPRSYPQTARLALPLAELRDQEIYLQGVTLLLDAAERDASA